MAAGRSIMKLYVQRSNAKTLVDSHLHAQLHITVYFPQ